MTPIKLGMIGFGMIASSAHFPAYLSFPNKVRVKGVCDKDYSLVEDASQRYGVKAYADYDELIQNSEIDAVDICLPPKLHASVALKAIKAGKHVFVEKPFTLDPSHAKEVITAARDNHVKLMVGHNMRFLPALSLAKRLIDSGVVGRICLVRASCVGNEVERLSNSAQWMTMTSEAGGGVIFDTGIHSFDLFRWLGGAVSSVFSSTTNILENLSGKIEDNAVGAIRYANGAVGTFSFSNTTACPWIQQLEVYGTKGAVQVDTSSQHPLRVLSAKTEHGSSGELGLLEEPFIPHSVTDWVSDSIRRELEHFADCILNDRPPAVSGEDAMIAVKLVKAAYESAKSGKEICMAE